MRCMLIAFVAGFRLLSHKAWANGDTIRGKKIVNKCKARLQWADGKNKAGPSLHKIVGRQSGSAEGFTRFLGLKNVNWDWAPHLPAYKSVARLLWVYS